MSASASSVLWFAALVFLVAYPVLSLRESFLSEQDPDIIFCIKFRVFVTNGFADNTNPLLIHCWSNDDDLGNHTLWQGQNFNFHFRTAFFKYTHFQCDMNWGPKNIHIDVFRKHYEDHFCCPTHTCLWKAQEDGIYFGIDGTHWQRNFTW